LSLLRNYTRHRFAWLLVTLLLTLAVNPVFEALFRVNPIEVLLAVNLIAAIASAARDRWLRVLLGFGLVYAAARVLGSAADVSFLRSASSIVWLSALVIAVVTTARHCVQRRDGRRRARRVPRSTPTCSSGCCSVSAMRCSTRSGRPRSARLAESDLSIARGIYFSFVTLATLGYGDVVPASDVTRGFVVLEAVIGQFYLAVAVARLVSLYSAARRS
jgi:voltage-gated potassium channel Kch